jgi:hypothetical protein
MRHLRQFGLVTVTAEQIETWKQYPSALFTLVPYSYGTKRGSILGTSDAPVDWTKLG